jgi:pantothenate kinase type III
VEIDGALDGGSVLPGFQLRLRDLFDEADRMPPA